MWLIALVVMLGAPAWADQKEEARAASQRGDYEAAYRLWSPLAEQGDAQAQYNVGWMCDNGKGVAQSTAEAVKWYEKSAAQNFAAAQTNLGVLYATGRGVVQNYAQAVRWYQKAADQGFAMAQNNLGGMYGNGWGVAQDYAQAYFWYQLASKNGDASAAANRDLVKARLTPEEIAKADGLVSAWKPAKTAGQ
jgi:TPR repeat protein